MQYGVFRKHKREDAIVMKRRILALVLALAMVAGLLPQLSLSAKAADSGTCGDNVTWTLDDTGVLTISGTGKMDNWESTSEVPWYSVRGTITSAVISDGVTAIGKNAFSYCSALSSVSIPGSVTSIESDAFYGCTSLASVSIPNSVTEIGSHSFYSCRSLQNLAIPESVSSLGHYTFAECLGLQTVQIPASLIEMGTAPFAWCDNLTAINVNAANPAFSSVDGVLFNKDQTTLIVYPGGKTGAYTVPDGVVNIGNASFGECAGLTSVVMPDSVTTVGSTAFHTCSALTSVTFGMGIASIGQGAFVYTGLKDVYYPGSASQWAEVTIASENNNLLWATMHYESDSWTPLVKTGTFSYDSHFIDTDAFYHYSYDENWFLKDSTKYQHNLARMSIRVAMAAAKTDYGSIVKLMDDLQFRNIKASYPTPTTETIGYAIGSKQIEDNGEPCTLIAVAVRGGGYEKEWGSNFNVGSGSEHYGFSKAANTVLESLRDYIDVLEINGRIKIWVTGYSRAAAVSNILGHHLNIYGDSGMIRNLDMEDIFVYCFECPRGAIDAQDSAAMAKNIFSIVNPVDAVPKVAPKDWDYGRYGTTYYLPSAETTYSFASLKSNMATTYKAILDNTSTINSGGKVDDAIEAMDCQSGFLDDVVEKAAWHLGGLKDGQPGASHYASAYQSQMIDIGEEIGTEMTMENIADLVYDVLTVAPTFAATHPILLSRTVLHASEIGKAHYPELCLAWMDAISASSLTKAEGVEDEGDEVFGDARSRAVRIGGAESVSVYDSADVLVAQYMNGEVQEIEGSTIGCYIEDGGRLVIWLPLDEEFRVEVEQAAEAVSYQVEELHPEQADPERLVCYPELTAQAGETLTCVAGTASEEPTAYTVTDGDGAAVAPETDLTTDDLQYCAIIASADGNGTVGGSGQFALGETVQLSAQADEGMRFVGWYENDVLVCEDALYRFTAEADRNLIARFEQIPDDEDPDVNPDDNPDDDDPVDEPCDGGADCPGAGFGDMPAHTNWAHEGIDYAVSNGLMNGITTTEFKPNGSLTRAQLVTILYRVAGQPESAYTGRFTDVPANAWFVKAVEWAAANGIVNGYSDGTFLPNKSITREQIATILYRYSGAPDVSGDALAGYPDVRDVHSYATDAMNWAVQNGLINGVSTGGVSYLRPQNTATRAQIAAIMMRYLENM